VGGVPVRPRGQTLWYSRYICTLFVQQFTTTACIVLNQPLLISIRRLSLTSQTYLKWVYHALITDKLVVLDHDLEFFSGRSRSGEILALTVRKLLYRLSFSNREPLGSFRSISPRSCGRCNAGPSTPLLALAQSIQVQRRTTSIYSSRHRCGQMCACRCWCTCLFRFGFRRITRARPGLTARVRLHFHVIVH
jgi:hypothetical protein